MYSEDLLQSHIAVGSDEIKEVKEYIFLDGEYVPKSFGE